MKLSEPDIQRWTNYALQIECDRCGRAIFAHEEDARAEVLHVAQHYDLGPNSPASEWRLYLRQSCGGFCEYFVGVGSINGLNVAFTLAPLVRGCSSTSSSGSPAG
jgi:hypothetical protein